LRSKDVLWREFKTGDSFQAIMSFIFGSMALAILTLVFILAVFVEGIIGIVLFISHTVIIITLVYWYWKKKTIEANQKEDVQGT